MLFATAKWKPLVAVVHIAGDEVSIAADMYTLLDYNMIVFFCADDSRSLLATNTNTAVLRLWICWWSINLTGCIYTQLANWPYVFITIAAGRTASYQGAYQAWRENMLSFARLVLAIIYTALQMELLPSLAQTMLTDGFMRFTDHILLYTFIDYNNHYMYMFYKHWLNCTVCHYQLLVLTQLFYDLFIYYNSIL